MTLLTDRYKAIEEPIWFGPQERPLFGWLTRPVSGMARGGVICAPPIGREARAGRRAMRGLAVTLAARGLVALRFDYEGTGDSSGGFNDVGRDQLWVDSVVEATDYLRSLSLETISAVGMRLGATLIGLATDLHQLNLSSYVLWDPCESGRGYLRELNALEALRRDEFQIVADAPIETSEYVFTPLAANEIRQIAFASTTSAPYAERTLVVARKDRAMPKWLRTNLSGPTVEWQETGEQAALLDVDPLKAMLPDRTINRIAKWLSQPPASFAPYEIPLASASAVVESASNEFAVSERTVELGAGRLFGIVSEPVGEAVGPLIVMLNVANEEHTGPARLWVELSRRWASFGLRSVRFDLSGLGDSPWIPGQPDPPDYLKDWLDDIIVVTQELNPDDPSNSVFVGLCSGAYLAIEAALEMQARGVCALNAPVCIDFLHGVRRLELSHRGILRLLGEQLKQVGQYRWYAAAVWYVFQSLVPASYAVDLLEQLEDHNVDLLLINNAEDLSPFHGVPFLRSMDVRRLSESGGRHIEFIPGLDHSMHFAEGRARAIDVLDRHVLERFCGVVNTSQSGALGTE